MALLVYYNQIRNDPSEVEYRFGETRDNLDRTLIIDKTNEAALPGQSEDGIFRTTVGRIIHRARREKEWPKNGMIAS
ncbi:hypothetical protein ACFWFQ_33835 [Nocardia salmonicida]|uniref:hypothetical protein n=1 Tax=Nocardia salmonicida TaxID=53431 RepID=UPI003663DC81